jgi:hypothetical protein
MTKSVFSTNKSKVERKGTGSGGARARGPQITQTKLTASGGAKKVGGGTGSGGAKGGKGKKK